MRKKPEERLTFKAMDTDKDKLFDPSLLKVTEATKEVAEETMEILEAPLVLTLANHPKNQLNASWRHKIIDVSVSDTVHTVFINAQKWEWLEKKISDILTELGVWKENLEEVTSLIQDIWKILMPKIEAKWVNFVLLKSYSPEMWLKRLFEADLERNKTNPEVINSVKNILSLSWIDNDITIRDIIISIYKEQLFEQYKNNKEFYLDKLKGVEKIDIWWDAISNFNKIASLSAEELREFFGNAKDVTELDTSFYDLNLLNNDQLEAIFSNVNKANTVSLNGCFSTIWNDKQEIIFKNLHDCETLNFTNNIVTEDTVNFMVKYLKNIKNIDFTMCDLTPEEKESIKSLFPAVDLCFEEEEDVNY